MEVLLEGFIDAFFHESPRPVLLCEVVGDAVVQLRYARVTFLPQPYRPLHLRPGLLELRFGQGTGDLQLIVGVLDLVLENVPDVHVERQAEDEG